MDYPHKWLCVTTVTVPTPVRPTLTYPCHSQVIRIIPEHPMPLPNPLAPFWANLHLSNALLNTPTPLRPVNTFPTWPNASSTPSLPRVKSIPNIHTHSRSNAIRPSLFCIKSIPDVSSVLQLRSGEAQSHTSLARCVLVRLPLLSIYLFPSCLLYVLCSHHSLPSFHFSVSFSVPHLHPPLFSSIFILSLCQPYSAILYLPYDSFLIVQIIPIITTPRTCINTLSTSCCSSVW